MNMKNMSMQAFITEFNIFARQLIKKYKIHTDKDKCIPRFHSVDKPDTNAKVNDEILSFISTFYENMDNIHTNYNREMSEDVKLEREIKSLMIDYMEEYLEDNKFFTIKDGKYIINRDKIEYTFSYDENECFESILEDYGDSTYGKIKIPEQVLYYIGYISRYICYTREVTSLFFYRTFGVDTLINEYYVLHTQSEEAVLKELLQRNNLTEDIFDQDKLLKDILRKRYIKEGKF